MDRSQMDFQSVFSKDSYYELQELSDGRLLTEDGHAFNIHKVELAKKNEYFYRLFCAMGKERNEYWIPGIKGKILGDILWYIYKGEISITDDDVTELLIASDYLLQYDLVKHIQESYITDNLSIKNCFALYIAVLHINQNDALKELFRFVQTHFEEAVSIEESKFVYLPLCALKHFLSDKNLRVKDENSVWSAIVKWVEADAAHRQFYIPELLMYLTSSDVDESVAMSILQHNLVVNNQFCEELNKSKEFKTFSSKRDILLNYIQNSTKHFIPLYIKKSPEHLYFIADFTQRNRTELHVTYDENIDLWRKITKINIYGEFIICIRHNIYIFNTTDGKNFKFNLNNKRWDVISHGHCIAIVHLEGSIFIFRRIAIHSMGATIYLEVYVPDFDLWYYASPIVAVTSFKAVVFDKRIFVVGHIFSRLEMIMQAYNAELDVWTALPAPTIFRNSFAFVAYREKLYIIGGRNEHNFFKNTEVFDTVKGEWSRHKNLPCYYYLPRATVLNDQLIVYDDINGNLGHTNLAVFWDEDLGDWRQFDESSPMNTLCKYSFFMLEDKECIETISKENKDPRSKFAKSPFN